MPWENSDPLSTAFGTAAAFLGGQQTARDRKRKESQEDEQDKQTALANQTAAGYKDAELKILQQNADTKTQGETDAATARTVAEAQKVKDDAQKSSDRRYATAMTALARSNATEAQRAIATQRIEAVHDDVTAKINAGVIKDDKEIAEKYAGLAVSSANNQRTTSTSAANNERSTSTSAANSVRSSETARADNLSTVGGANARAANAAAMSQYKIQSAANTAAVAAGNDPPYPDLKPPAPAAAAATPVANPAVDAFVKVAATVPKAQRVKLVTTSKPYLSADSATQKAILSAVQALP